MKTDPFEIQFGADMKSFNHSVEAANFYQQTIEHWDWLVDSIRVEVKGPKDFPRGTRQPHRLLVEWQAVIRSDGRMNNPGWVRGKADWIAFKLAADKEWIWVKRSELESRVAHVDWVNFTYSNFRLPDYKAYRRDGRNDLMCLIPKAHVLLLPSTKISLDMPDSF
ncbi:MAG: hypothetical protein ABSE80_12750 [Halobacteriota archaeon]|jgi:hypothetical protein